MALTRANNPVLFSTADTVNIVAGTIVTSDLFTIGVSAIDVSITISAKNIGAPASGDIVRFYLSASSGSADGIAGDDFPAATLNALPLGEIDTEVTDDFITINIPAVPRNFKLIARNDAGSNAIEVGAAVEELRAD